MGYIEKEFPFSKKINIQLGIHVGLWGCKSMFKPSWDPCFDWVLHFWNVDVSKAHLFLRSRDLAKKGTEPL